MGCEAEIGEIFAFEMKRDRLLNIAGQFVQCRCLSNDGQVEAFSDVLLLTLKNANLDDALQERTSSTLY